MPEVNIPLVSGVDEAVDTKLLPTGALSVLTNGRIRKPGKIGPRNGYDGTELAPSSLIVASAEMQVGYTLSVKERSLVNELPQIEAIVETNAGTVLNTSTTPAVGTGAVSRNSSLTTLGGVSRSVVPFPCVAGDAASDLYGAGKYLVCAHCDMDVIGGSATPLGVVTTTLYDSATLRPLGNSVLDTGGGGVAATNPHIVAIGTTFLIFCARGATIRVGTWDSTSASTSPFQAGTAVCVTATSVAAAKLFHVAPYDSSNVILCFQSAATTMEWGFVNASGVYTQMATWVVVNAVRNCLCRVGNGSSNIAVIWADGATFSTGNCSYGVWDSAGAVVTAATALDSTGEVAGFPMVAPIATTGGIMLVWSNDRGPAATNSNKTTTRLAGSSTYALFNMVPASLPFTLRSGTYIWMADAAKTRSGGSVIGPATYRLYDALFLSAAGGLPAAGGCANLKALPAKYMLGFNSSNDNRRQVVSCGSQSPMPSVSAAVTVLPVLGNDGLFAPELTYIEDGVLAERLQTCKTQNTLFFSGPRVTVYDGSQFYPSGLFSGPAEIYAADGGVVASGLGAGTYQYVAVWELRDGNGQRTFSAPSNPVSITVIANTQVNLTASGAPPSSNRGHPAVTLVADYSLVWYRTLAGGTVFHRIEALPRVAGTALDIASMTATADIALDAAISDNETLYTQGERGGLSGLLQNDEPPSAKFLAAGSDRVILGGLDDATAVQFSKLIFPGEPIQWTSSDSHRAIVDEAVSGVAALDGIWYVFTRSAIWAISGAGPDDSGQGSFDVPRRLPSPVGCLSGRSLLETPDGLMFQGQSGIYLLPRGGGAPVWIGDKVQDTLASYPIVTATYFDKSESLAYFACCNSAGSQGIVLVYDVEHAAWSVDSISNTLVTTISKFNGSILLNGRLQQLSGAWKDNFTGAQNLVVPTVTTTGDIRPFGILGHGRTRKVVILGEHRSASNSTMLVEESADSGATYTTIGSFTMAGTAGTSFTRECLLKYQLGTAYRFRITMTPSASTVEAPIVNAVTLQVFKSEGTPRLAASERA